MRSKSFGLPVVTLMALEIGPVKRLKFCAVLSGMRILFSESVVFHLVFWVSSFVVGLGCVCVWVCFVSTLEDT